jgi:hypothetical protein
MPSTTKGQGSLALFKTVYVKAGLPDPSRHSGEVAVAGYDAKGVEAIAV